MEKIGANRLIVGTKTWAEVPDPRRGGVLVELAARVESGASSPERFEEITGEAYED